MPSISELLITLALIVAIGVATRFFGKPALGKEQGGEASRAGASRDKGKKLKKDSESGVYVPESDDAGDD